MASPASLPDLIKAARQAEGLSQKDFGAIFGKHQSLISRYEKGEASPPSKIIMHCMHKLDGERREAECLSLDKLVQQVRERLGGEGRDAQRQALRAFLEVI